MSTLFAFACTECKMGVQEQIALPEDCITLANEKMSITIGKDGKLYSLKNEITKQEYASTAGDYLWRIYYDTHTEEEIQVLGEGQNVEVSQEGNSIILNYPSVKAHGKEISEIHFHEVGTMDAVADIVGVCVLLEQIDADKIVVSPLATGYGQV